MFENIKNNKHNVFYNVDFFEIEQVEKELDIRLPSILKKFYFEVGYGFIKGSEGNVNRLMDPRSVRDFRMREKDFEFYPDIEIYDAFEENKLIFFEGNESALISIEIGNDKSQAIYYYDTKICDSLEEFLNRITEDDTFYYDAV